MIWGNLLVSLLSSQEDWRSINIPRAANPKKEITAQLKWIDFTSK